MRYGAVLSPAGVVRPVRFERGSSSELKLCHPREATERMQSLAQEAATAGNAAHGARGAKFERCAARVFAAAAQVLIALELLPP